MSNFIVSDWFANRASLNIQTFEVEGVVFELMALTGELKEEVELCESYEDMLSLAANSGLSYSRKRVVDDSELAKDIDMLWGIDNLDLESDPCIQYRVGEKVCDISGLSDALAEQLNADKAAALIAQGHIDSDNDKGEFDTVNIDSLNSDLAAKQNVS